MALVEIMPYFFLILKGLLFFVAVVFLVSGLDDFFIDLYFAGRSVCRQWFILPKYHPLTEKQLLAPPERPIAVMIPAWEESAVIGPMLENTIRTLNYANYHIFVGTYPNDPDTQREVEAVREHFDNLHRIVCPKDGLSRLGDFLRQLTPAAKLAISGFANGRADPQTLGIFWQELLAATPIDLVLFQDGIGAGKLTLDDLPLFLTALHRAAVSQGREFQVVVELFQQLSARPFKAQPAPGLAWSARY